MRILMVLAWLLDKVPSIVALFISLAALKLARRAFFLAHERGADISVRPMLTNPITFGDSGRDGPFPINPFLECGLMIVNEGPRSGTLESLSLEVSEVSPPMRRQTLEFERGGGLYSIPTR